MFVLDTPPEMRPTQTVTRTVTALIFIKPTQPACANDGKRVDGHGSRSSTSTSSTSSDNDDGPSSCTESTTSSSQPQPTNTPQNTPNRINHSNSQLPSDWRSQMLKQVNDIRAKADKPPMAMDDRLTAMAQAHSEYQAKARNMTHNDPDGGLGDRARKWGIRGWGGLAENVAMGSKDVPSVMQQWIDSQGHYNNLIGNYTMAGFGVSSYYWTQNFFRLL
ncbi:hypothetical protein H4R18_000392 [Coemansia javaensis]|uniref:SCP domain-containing protein n=1 Tax=Coemansia javaensis TaxID=2761396 RepID=A0A9W8HNT7_9FUNG|nr:hypothetical protein H4R18_000392 [Coemansia javaensis]